MNLPLFITKRIAKNADGAFSSTINRIAIISIGLGLSVLLLSFMVLFGFQTAIKDKIYSLSGHLLVTNYSLNTSFEENSIQVSDSIISILNTNSQIASYQKYAMKAGLLKTKEEVQGVIMKGVEINFDSTILNNQLIEGRAIKFKDTGYSTEVIISKKVAQYLELQLNQEVLMYFVQDPPRFRKLQIVGIYETGLEEFDEKIIIGDLGLIQRLNGWEENQAGGLEVFLKNAEMMDEIEQELFYSLPNEIYVDKVSDKYIQIFDWLNLLNRNVLVLLIIISIVACTSVISIMLILIMERTQMIGLLKAIGANNALIRNSFVWNGLLLVSKGMLWGNIIGVGFGLVQFYFKLIPLDQANYYMSHVPIEFSIVNIILLNLSMALIIGITLFIPVRIISKVEPVKAIRFD